VSPEVLDRIKYFAIIRPEGVFMGRSLTGGCGTLALAREFGGTFREEDRRDTRSIQHSVSVDFFPEIEAEEEETRLRDPLRQFIEAEDMEDPAADIPFLLVTGEIVDEEAGGDEEPKKRRRRRNRRSRRGNDVVKKV
jgi:hypothetical protein